MSILLSRGIVGLFYLYSGIKGFLNLDDKINQVASGGVPFAHVIVPISLLLLLVAGFTIITGYEIRIGIVAVALFILPVTLFVYDFWNIAESVRRISEWNGLQSSLALMAYGEAAFMARADTRSLPGSGRRSRLRRLGRRLMAAVIGCRFERAYRRPSVRCRGTGSVVRRRSSVGLASRSALSANPQHMRRKRARVEILVP
jgi:uncharacterized membrane protein YphA (DoxX/SURF4 family)